MPDISMCQNKECPLRESCYRFTAMADPNNQYYADFQFTTDQNGSVDCEAFVLDMGVKVVPKSPQLPPQEF